ncbi:GNAT family N-acetyltransferase [Blastococcus saxobsidens]|uniref:RimJ/RimL family protein N-acetyltransferase n=1 Tax=Blastococcus saxobsidens TaxID=138336 RepID=A0A4Q7Y9S6_9ACTN|nr:GNAT family N-acetyltransferase [Blastococcus saxobsidens]RZU33897.1 RimJ/RimL family protein N-acetyltransferase [Blastococcus saxobsidens]
MEPPELTPGPLGMRPWRDDDVDALFAAQQDPVARLWSGTGGVSSRADAVALLATLRTDADRASWAVVDGATGELLGSVSVHSIDPRQGDAQIGYWTAPPARGRGVAPTAVDAACRWAFDALPVERIELCHAVENAASARVAEKAGFTYEGRLRRSFRYGDGVKHDELLWARLDDDPAPSLPG